MTQNFHYTWCRGLCLRRLIFWRLPTLWTELDAWCYYVVTWFSIGFHSITHGSPWQKGFWGYPPGTLMAKPVGAIDQGATCWSSSAIFNCVGTRNSLDVLTCWRQHLLSTLWTEFHISLQCGSTITKHSGLFFLKNIENLWINFTLDTTCN